MWIKKVLITAGIMLGCLLMGNKIDVQAAAGSWESGNTIVTIDESGTMTVSPKEGTDGRMKTYDPFNSPAPWYEDGKSVNKLYINEGVTYVGGYALTYLGSLVEEGLSVVSLPESDVSYADSSLSSMNAPNVDLVVHVYPGNVDGFCSLSKFKSLTIKSSGTMVFQGHEFGQIKKM